MRESKVEESINLKQGLMTVKEYSLKFVKLSKYATSLMSKCIDEMSRFFTGIAEDLEENCRAAMFYDNMHLFRHMVHIKRWRNAGGGNTLGQGTCQGKLRRIFQGRVVLESGISQSLRRDSPTKGSQIHPRVAMIGILSQELRETMK